MTIYLFIYCLFIYFRFGNIYSDCSSGVYSDFTPKADARYEFFRKVQNLFAGMLDLRGIMGKHAV